MSDINTIDYGPLEADKHAFKIIFNRHKIPSIAIFVGAAALCFLSFFVGLAVAMGWMFYLAAQVRALKNAIWEGFAAANGWPVNTELAPQLLLPPSLQFGHGQTFSPVVTAELGDTDADLFVYETEVGEGKSQQTYYFSVARVLLPVALPYIMLRAKKGVSSEVRQDVADHETLQLEGDFDDYFSLQIEKGQEVSVLEILTPDVMQTLVSFSQREDIEIVANGLYFIVSGDERTPESIKTLIQSVAALHAQIVEQIAQTTVPAVFPVQTAEAAPQPAVAV